MNPIKLAQPSLTGGDDQPERPCTGHWVIYDALIDNPRNGYAAKEAADICGTCPIAATCLRAHAEDEWPHPVVRLLRRRAKARGRVA